ncbi:MAG: hypothetical protein KGJ84_10110 [Elusimicrobia bacterium]|nr:hypothetical protein [Elusimicrobiota bacterium]
MNGNHDELTDYLDGRLTAEGREAFEARLAAEPALARRLRLFRALRASLASTAPRMPSDLKAELKRRARSRTAAGPSWVERLLASLPSPGPGLGAAVATAALLATLQRALPARKAPPAPRPSPAVSARLAAVSSDLWTDDDGSDHED